MARLHQLRKRTRPPAYWHPWPPCRLLLIWLCLYLHAVQSFVLEATLENEAAIMEAVAYYNDANHAAGRGDKQLAIQLYERAIETYAPLPAAYNNLGMLVYDVTKDRAFAIALLEKGIAAALEIGDRENVALLHNNIGYILRDRRQHSVDHALQAIELYDAALEIDPEYLDALYNKASALNAMGKLEDARALLVRVLDQKPDHVSAHLDLGAIFFRIGDIDRAVRHQDAVITHATKTHIKIGALHNKGHFLKSDGRLVEALQAHEDAVAIAPLDAIALTDLVTAKRTLCLWDEREQLLDRMLGVVLDNLRLELDHGGATRGTSAALLPYDATLIPLSDTTRKQLAIVHAREYQQSATLELLPRRDVAATTTTTSNPMPTGDVRVASPAERRPLRIGYLTFDFRDHPMGHLTLGLLDAHDPSRVDVYCYSYGTNDASEWRRRAEDRCDVFYEGALRSDLEIAQRIALDQVDIVVDLMAHTTGARLGITALRPSAIVVNYLGYPGTMGSTFTDFVLADRFVLPPEVAKASMTEQIVYLPHAYQVNEYDLEIAACGDDNATCQRAIRKSQGLPEHGVVFCNFNTINKMEPVSFSVWMNVLRRVPSSVLWLLEPSKQHGKRIEATLRLEAQARGVDPTRLYFAQRETKRSHLARLTAADVFLDSFVYNAHSTAADVLWANVPIVSLHGDTFPARVAASLHRNLVDSQELVPHSIKEYEDLAVQLAESPQLLRRWRREVAAQSLVAPLFDTTRTATNIETAYEAMHDVRHGFSFGYDETKTCFQILVEPSTTEELTPVGNSDQLLKEAVAHAITKQERGEFAKAIAVYERVLRTQPRHSDALHLLGAAYYQMGELNRALQQLTRTVETYNTTALFWYNRAVVLAKLNRSDDAASDLRAALTLNPTYTGAFFKLVDMLLAEAKFEQLAVTYETFGSPILRTETETDATTQDHDQLPDTERERAYLQYSFALSKLGRTSKAIDLLEHATRRFPTFFRLGYNLAAIHSSLGQHATGDQHQIRTAEAEARHVFDGQGRQFVKRQRPRGRRVVVFYCHEYGQSWWDAWGPSSLKRTGLGGSEEAVVFMANELQRLGYWVEVYGNPPDDDITLATASDDDTTTAQWYPHYAFDPDDRDVDVFIAWRYHISLAVATRSKRKFFWVHDVPSDDTKHSHLLTSDSVAGILCVSRFQASLFPQQLAHKLIVTSNALDPAYFVDNVTVTGQQRSTRFVYGSSPSRGLAELLQAWPRIRARVPHATLRVFYGFTPAFMNWGRRHIPQFDTWKRRMDEMLLQPGVEYVGLVDHETLAHEYANAGFYLYPTTYSETSCVSLMKAMANGAIPLTSRYTSSALSETCDVFDLGPRALLPGKASVMEDDEWLELWIASIADAVHQQAATADLRQRMVQFARSKYQWSSVAAQWHELFKHIEQASV